MIADFPAKLEFLFSPARYKVAHGGRGSGKSWGFARALLLQGASEPLRILCTREVQKSIKDSVHKLLSDQIQALGLGWFYTVLENEIRGKNGTEITFAGLASHTIESIKSYEGVDRVWIEEGQVVRKRSWDVLIPTIRKPGSEIWLTYNPEMETDETHQRFAVNPPPDAVVVQVNYSDNPWFPAELEAERQHSAITNPKDYAWIWEGKCKPAVAGAIYYDEVVQSSEGNRICNVPYDPKLKVHTIWDLGWNDSMAIILAQRAFSEVRLIGYMENSHKTLDWYVTELQKLRYNWGADYLPHDGNTRDYKTGKSAAEILRAFGRTVNIVPKISIETGIKAARMAFPMTVFDKVGTARLQECLKRYRRSINLATNEPGVPLHDEFSHGADVFRYYATVADQLSNDDHHPASMMPEFTEDY